MTTQREKDLDAASEAYMHQSDLPPNFANAFADGAEYGRADLAKLERLLRAGWVIKPGARGFALVHCVSEDQFHGATLAEALEQVKE